jgi:hypothetical protein
MNVFSSIAIINGRYGDNLWISPDLKVSVNYRRANDRTNAKILQSRHLPYFIFRRSEEARWQMGEGVRIEDFAPEIQQILFLSDGHPQIWSAGEWQ